ncbi:hypothetical protein RSWS8N_06245 [Cereibacter sphaeroides WS8N]|uniref:hypothetical protein n=1 Tax=Cereibacter sphaeroides TaxID=1063 RepID=UPI00020DF44B|nr:hypothetical protein [Cereibacter sphaeroides]EGJ21661.1 hypothetical protein RSWS8N_06245 [Cereibacter sphaeroides WS8N]
MTDHENNINSEILAELKEMKRLLQRIAKATEVLSSAEERKQEGLRRMAEGLPRPF